MISQHTHKDLKLQQRENKIFLTNGKLFAFNKIVKRLLFIFRLKSEIFNRNFLENALFTTALVPVVNLANDVNKGSFVKKLSLCNEKVTHFYESVGRGDTEERYCHSVQRQGTPATQSSVNTYIELNLLWRYLYY